MKATTTTHCAIVAAAILAGAAAANPAYTMPWYANPATASIADADAQAVALKATATANASAYATLLAEVNTANGTSYAGTLRMSHTDYFRPRLYILEQDGTLTVLRLESDSSAINWTTTYTSAELASVAGGAGTVTDIEVTDDGGTAFVEFGNSGGYVALQHTAPTWRYYAADESGNPTNVNCITDGKWILMCGDISDGRFIIGNYTKGNKAILNDPMGECLDLSKGTVTTASGTAKISNCVYSLQNANGKSPRIVYYPALSDGTPNNVGLQNTKAEELIFVNATATKINNWSTCECRRMVLDLPKVTSVGTNGFSSSTGTTGDKSNFADFNLPTLKFIDKCAWQNWLAEGILTLPAITNIVQQAFYGCDKMEEALLSPENNTLVRLGSQAFAASSSGGSLKRVTLGCAEGFTLSVANAFDRQPLEVVTFTGAVPNITAATAWPDAAANTMVFVIPRGNAAWDAIAAGATLLSEAERKAYHTAHPDHPIPFGVISTGAFKTHYAQYVAWSDSMISHKLSVERNTFFDDTVAISADWAPFADGTYPDGTVVTLSATPNATGTFRKWYGDVDKSVCSNATISLTLTDDAWLYARIVHPWTLAANKQTATDGNFTVNCSVRSESARTLTLGKQAVSGLFADTNAGEGVIDLGGPVMLGNEEWKFSVPAAGHKTFKGTGNVTAFISPGNLDNPAGSSQQSFNGAAYRLVILDEPSVSAWYWPDWYLGGSATTHLILQLPTLASFPGNRALYNALITETKFDWWDLSGMTSMHADAFLYTTSTYSNGKGSIVLPRMRDMNNRTLRKMPNLEGITLGGWDNATTVTNLPAKAFEGDTSLKRLVLHADAAITVGATPFFNGRTPDEIYFTGAAPTSATAIENLLDGVGSGNAPVIIRVAQPSRGWVSAQYVAKNATAEEKALAGDDARNVFGAYRGNDGGTPYLKALFVWDEAPGATVVIMR